ncbi:MAG TPA: RnfABCDGE type electron transport complex subunit B [Gammaproteobacteria bacterium]|nr:RnfABCDGE type electron transport complex subunit B [Gammaproteobacteria bacterium]
MISLAESIDALLPQTQCQRCGYVDCRAYAEAIAADDTDINRCPPGGQETLEALAALTGRVATSVDPTLGGFALGQVAFVIEPECIGCTKCIQACPVDAIVGAAKQMHTVIEAQCTGCGLCIPPCPVDCIRMQPARGTTEGVTIPVDARQRADFFRARYLSRSARLAHDKAEHEKHLDQPMSSDRKMNIVAQRKAEIAAAVARVQAKRAQRTRASKKHES